MGIRQDQCNKVCRIIDDYLANRPRERDELIVAVRTVFKEADRKTENSSEKPNNCELQTIRCPKCGRTDYIRDMENDMGIKGSRYKYKCINCNTYIKDEPQTEREGER